MTSHSRNAVQQAWHRLVGARGATNIFHDQISSSAKGNSNFGHIYPQSAAVAAAATSVTTAESSSAAKEIARHRLVFFGEIHSMPPIVAFQREVQNAMVDEATSTSSPLSSSSPSLNNENEDSNETGKVHVIIEHFSFELQDFLDDFSSSKISFEELVQKYHEIGEEGHDLLPYKELFEDARKNKSIMLHAGFLPRKFSRMLLREGSEETIQAASSWLPSLGNIEGNSFHYNIFESLLSGRSLFQLNATNTTETTTPSDQFRRIFDAQVLKDIGMAHKVNGLIDNQNDGNAKDRFLVIAGNGHLLHYTGVPERILSEHPEMAKDTCLVISESTDGSSFDESKIKQRLAERFGPEGSNPADYVFLYEIPEEILHDWEVKEETQRAYDKVGESANLPGNSLKAAWIMYSMKYTEEQFKVAGSDAYNFQGVGNPHVHADIQPGQTILDVGSGLGIDSFIACNATGTTGKVIGIDISAKEVRHAQERAQARGLTNLEFHRADMEQIPLPDNSVDRIISNGAFCLAPNKKKAFEELYRVLRPGGKISVCTTTTQVDHLEPGVSWPLCMKMFVAKKELEPLCQEIGYCNVVIDDSDSSMTMEIPEEVLKNSNPDRNRVHVGGSDFEHLENFDMDAICARVCVVAQKPLNE